MCPHREPEVGAGRVGLHARVRTSLQIFAFQLRGGTSALAWSTTTRSPCLWSSRWPCSAHRQLLDLSNVVGRRREPELAGTTSDLRAGHVGIGACCAPACTSSTSCSKNQLAPLSLSVRSNRRRRWRVDEPVNRLDLGTVVGRRHAPAWAALTPGRETATSESAAGCGAALHFFESHVARTYVATCVVHSDRIVGVVGRSTGRTLPVNRLGLGKVVGRRHVPASAALTPRLQDGHVGTSRSNRGRASRISTPR
jgi:hypothetical protein